MIKNLFTSNSNRLPLAFILSLSIFLAINVFIHMAFDTGFLKNRDNYLRRVKVLSNHPPSKLFFLGDSRVGMVNSSIQSDLLNQPADSVMVAEMGGATPRTFFWLLSQNDFMNIIPGGTCVIFISPMQLNYNNRLFERTIDAFFNLKLFWSELIKWRQYRFIKYYLSNCLIPLQRYKNHLKDNVKHFLSNKGVQSDELWTTPSVDEINPDNPATDIAMKHWLSVYLDENLGNSYILNEYQIHYLDLIIQELSKKQIKIVLVVPPTSEGVIELLGDDRTIFMNAVQSLAAKYRIPYLDYLAPLSQYQFKDSLHLINSSKEIFNYRIAEDLKEIEAT